MTDCGSAHNTLVCRQCGMKKVLPAGGIDLSQAHCEQCGQPLLTGCRVVLCPHCGRNVVVREECDLTKSTLRCLRATAADRLSSRFVPTLRADRGGSGRVRSHDKYVWCLQATAIDRL